MELIYLIPFCIAFYFFGNINLSVVVSKFRKRDIRKVGSGNAGATNMLRAFGPKVAVPILLLDIAKGVIPALVGLFVFADYYVAMLALGLATVIGHCFPVFFKFKGGKGAATIVGVFLVVNPVLTAAVFGICLVIYLIVEFASISSIVLISVVAVYELVYTTSIAASCILVAFYALVIFNHRSNVISLLSGREKKASLLGRLIRKVRKKTPAS